MNNKIIKKRLWSIALNLNIISKSLAKYVKDLEDIENEMNNK